MRGDRGIPSAVYSPIHYFKLLVHFSHTSGFTLSENMGNPNSLWLPWSHGAIGSWQSCELPDCPPSNKALPQLRPSLLLSGAAGRSGNDEAQLSTGEVVGDSTICTATSPHSGERSRLVSLQAHK